MPLAPLDLTSHKVLAERKVLDKPYRRTGKAHGSIARRHIQSGL
jgi:hypothetical protein